MSRIANPTPAGFAILDKGIFGFAILDMVKLGSLFLTWEVLKDVFITSDVLGQDYYYDEYEDYSSINDDDDSDELPKFLATPQSFSVEIGDEITLPCDIDRKNNTSYPLLFKFISLQKNDRTIYVGEVKVSKYSRIRKIGNSFVIPKVKKNDAGDYICRFETVPVVQLSHTLNVQYPAKVARVSEEVQKVVQGSSVTLECQARGNPSPAITWSKKDGYLPSGAKSEEGLSIIFEEVDRHVEGTYICTASNGIGEPSSTFITIQVEYKPEIISEQAIMNTANGYEAVLVCVVHGRPKPNVVWYRGESPVSSEKHVMTHDGAHRNTLTIIPVSEDDFGEYTCTAENKYGKKYNTLYLTGLPTQPEITSSPAGGEKSSYTLTWKTETFAPIIQYRLKYKKVSEGQPHTGPRVWTADKLFSPPRTSVRDTRFSHGVIEMKHPLQDLQPAEDYEAIVGVENKFGWSPDSEVFKFFTRKEMAVGQSSNVGFRLTGLSLWVFASLVFLFFL